MEMGFPKDLCREALEKYAGDEQLTLNFLLGSWKDVLYNFITIKKIFLHIINKI